MPHIGLLWERYKPDYPRCEQVAPLMPIVEAFGRPSEQRPELVDMPPLPRVWFVHESGNGIIQLQLDRFLHNRRKLKKEDKYPRYETVYAKFSERLEMFRTFLDEQKLGRIDALQYEMTYLNHIFQGEGWNTTCETGNVFPDFSGQREKRFLPCAESIHWRTAFVLPDQIGRLHATIRNGESSDTGHPYVSLT